MTRPREFGQWLASVRRKKRPKVSQAELGTALGLHQSVVSNIERGLGISLSLEQLETIAKLLEVDIAIVREEAGWDDGNTIWITDTNGRRFYVVASAGPISPDVAAVLSGLGVIKPDDDDSTASPSTSPASPNTSANTATGSDS